MKVMAGTCVVLITVDGQKTADKITRALITRRLAACVNAVKGVSSVYWWKGKVEKAKEILLIAKTKSSLRGKLTKEVKKLHPYTVPEIIFLDIKAGNGDYLKWIREETR